MGKESKTVAVCSACSYVILGGWAWVPPCNLGLQVSAALLWHPV